MNELKSKADEAKEELRKQEERLKELLLEETEKKS